MTNKQQNIAVALASKWLCPICSQPLHGVGKITGCCGCGFSEHIPDYGSNRDAMLDVVGKLPTELRDKYIEQLINIVLGEPVTSNCVSVIWLIITATAVQHREAYLRTIGKWRDE